MLAYICILNWLRTVACRNDDRLRNLFVGSSLHIRKWRNEHVNIVGHAKWISYFLFHHQKSEFQIVFTRNDKRINGTSKILQKQILFFSKFELTQNNLNC